MKPGTSASVIDELQDLGAGVLLLGIDFDFADRMAMAIEAAS